MLELVNDTMVFSFPEVHPDAKLEITLMRTLRIPDDGKSYPLPPGLGRFPIRHVDDYSKKVPKKWLGRGGVMVPLYQAEALWVNFNPSYVMAHGYHYPFAVKIATGKCSAITGKKWIKGLKEKDYVVCPNQKWIDGYVVEDGTVRQFVAAPLGMGITAEEQITGKAEFGGLQIEVVPMTSEKFLKRYPKQMMTHPRGGFITRAITHTTTYSGSNYGSSNVYGSNVGIVNNVAVPASAGALYSCELNCSVDMNSRGITADEIIGASDDSDCLNLDMGLAPGGKMEQQIFADPYGIDDWHKSEKSRCYVHMSNSLAWEYVTEQKPPATPVSAHTYTTYGLPWFEFYEEGVKSQKGTEVTKGLKSAKDLSKEKGLPFLPENQSAEVKNKTIIKSSKTRVRDGVWK